jgi:hypothetical protein
VLVVPDRFHISRHYYSHNGLVYRHIDEANHLPPQPNIPLLPPSRIALPPSINYVPISLNHSSRQAREVHYAQSLTVYKTGTLRDKQST